MKPVHLSTVLLLTLAFTPAVAHAQDATPLSPERAAAAPPAEPNPSPSGTALDVDVDVDVEAQLRLAIERALDTFTELSNDRPGTTDPDAAAAASVASAPSMASARASLEAARAGARRALYGFVPQLDGRFRYTRISNVQGGSIGGDIDPVLINSAIAAVDDPNARILFSQIIDPLTSQSFPVLRNQYAFTVSVAVPLTDLFLTVLPAYRSALSAERAQEHQQAVSRRAVALQAREAYFEVVRAIGARAVAEQALEQAEENAAQIARVVQAGAMARVELLRIRAVVANARVGVAQARMGEALAERALRTLMHSRDPVQVRLALLAEPVETAQSDAELDALAQRAFAARPEVLALVAAREAQEGQVTVARAGRYPRVALQANIDVANPNSRIFPQRREWNTTWDVSAVVSWSLQDTLAARASARQAEAEVSRIDADVLAIQDGVRLEVIQAALGADAAWAALTAAAVGLEAAQENRRVRFEQLRAGAAVATDLLDAEVELSRARVDVVNAAVGLELSRVRLSHSLGE